MASSCPPQTRAPLVCVTPVPDKEIAGELLALLETEAVPVELPVVVGVNATFSAADFPGASAVLELIPFALKPAPEAVTLEMVTLELPVLVRVTANVLLLPLFTFPKFKLVGLATSE